MPDTDGAWATTRFVDSGDLRHDMHVNIVTFQPGGSIPFAETHVMEHGLYVLEGKAVYRLNQDWVEVEAGDYMWLRAFCPQACYAGGPGLFRYLLYKDVNRIPTLPRPRRARARVGPGGSSPTEVLGEGRPEPTVPLSWTTDTLHMPLAQIEGGDIYYEESGSGAVLAMLLPLSAGPIGVGPFCDRLAGRFRVIRYDQRGTGRSAPVAVRPRA